MAPFKAGRKASGGDTQPSSASAGAVVARYPTLKLVSATNKKNARYSGFGSMFLLLSVCVCMEGQADSTFMIKYSEATPWATDKGFTPCYCGPERT